jgi:hypothetical protein
VSLQSQAVHGDGIFQISLTSDIDDGFKPRKDSRFFIIHSVEGGCPARNVMGSNLESPNTDKYYFKIQQVWALVSMFYRGAGCSGEAASRSTIRTARPLSLSLTQREDLSGLWMAISSELTGGCTHAEAQRQQTAIAYPDPGKYVERPNPEEKLFPQPYDGNPRVRAGARSISSTKLRGTSLLVSSTASLSSVTIIPSSESAATAADDATHRRLPQQQFKPPRH